jgi:DNA-binding NarL/FixJ family response regulator
MTSILIIDDHALFRTGISEVLRVTMDDLRIFEAASIREACLIDTESPTLILLDIVLNGLNGLDGIQLLHKQWASTPILMLSSDQSPQTQQTALAQGAIGFLHKGSSTEYIVLAIQQALKGEIQNQLNVTVETNASRSLMRGAEPSHLTARQIEVLDLLCIGLSNKLIARKLDCSENTVRGHIQAILHYLQVSTRNEAVYAARKLGLVA